MARDNFSIHGYDNWKTRAPEDEPGYWDDKEPEPDDDEDDENRCELLQDEDSRCPNRATQQVEEPYTPGRFRMNVCDECATSQISMGYRSIK